MKHYLKFCCDINCPSPAIRIGVLCFVILACIASPICALPPLGVTFVNSNATAGGLRIIDGSAYLNSNGIHVVDSSGNVSAISLFHPTLGAPLFATRVVKAADSGLHVAASFGSLSNYTGAALYQLGRPDEPLITWPEGSRIHGITTHLRVLGNCDGCDNEPPYIREASEFLLDGSTTLLPLPPESNQSALTHISAAGFALGYAHLPNTLAYEPAFWTPSKEFSFIGITGGIVGSLEDRVDLQGANIGLMGGETSPYVIYGPHLAVEIKDELGVAISNHNVVVSSGDFAVVVPDSGSGNFYGYYPSVVAGFPDRARPLVEVFPQLSSLDVVNITALAAVDGYIYMSIMASDGLYLFGAHDPSAVPEPASTPMFIISIAAGFLRSRRTTSPKM